MPPTLVLLAAGMGSRYGGPKQIDPVGPGGATLIDYAAFDARRVGWDHVVLVVRTENHEAVRRASGERIARHLRVDYAVQDQALPTGFRCPAGRTKPWGTGHAVVAAAPLVEGSFAVLNADDFYGSRSYRILADWLASPRVAGEHALVTFALRDTLSTAGSVNRGVCHVDANGFLLGVREVLKIEARGPDATYPGGGGSLTRVRGDTPVSLNFWGFGPDALPLFEEAFQGFLAVHGESTADELYIPDVVRPAIEEGAIRVRALAGGGPWAGLTHREDRPRLVAHLENLTARGEYPEDLWP